MNQEFHSPKNVPGNAPSHEAFSSQAFPGNRAAGAQTAYGASGGFAYYSGELPPAAAPAASKRPRFTASPKEKLTAFLTFIPAYFYAKMFCEGLLPWVRLDLRYPDLMWRIDFAVFLVTTIALTVFIFFREKHHFESMVWLGCLLSCGVSVVFRIGNVWEDYHKLLFAHGFLPYFVLSFSDRLSEGRSGRLILMDAANVLFIVPFKRFSYRIRTMIAAFRDGFSQKENRQKGAALWALLAVLSAAVLLPVSVYLLTVADRSFASLVSDFYELLGANWGRYIGYFFLSLPVGAFVYGLLGGFFRESIPQIRNRGSMFLRGIRTLRKVTPLVWAVLLMIFSAVYTVFFIVQWQSLFDAFRGICPADPRSYVRESFFALCKVSVINFLLLCIIQNSARDLEKKDLFLTITKVLLLFCNIVFCVIAMSRIVLYIKTWDFTPLRLQSAWLVATLFLGCAAAVIAVISGKRTMRAWMIAASGMLSVLCFV